MLHISQYHRVLILLALLQGVALLALEQAIELNYWPSTSNHWLFALYTLAISAPIMLVMSLTPNNQPRSFLALLPLALLLSASAYYIGWQYPQDGGHYSGAPFLLTLTTLLVAFKGLMYGQAYANQRGADYATLFAYSWQNAFVILLATLFTGLFWAVLMLWAGLFKVLNVSFFDDVFTSRWFYYPALTLAFTYAVQLFIRQQKIIATLRTLLQTAITFLLPLASVISLTFLLALPFTGLQPLWNTGTGTGLMLTLQGLMLFFCNAVYQTQQQNQVYHLWLHRLIYLSLTLLPIYSLIACYGLWLRVEQYGWSIDRLWASAICLLLACFAVGYSLAVIRYKSNWLQGLNWLNVRLGIAVAMVVLLMQSPLFNLRAISVDSQLARLEQGKVSADDFDYGYFYRALGRPGAEALQVLKTGYQTSRPDLVKKIDNLRQFPFTEQERGEKVDQLLASLQESNPDLPANLMNSMKQHLQSRRWALQSMDFISLIQVDADSDGVNEQLLITHSDNAGFGARLFVLQDEQWTDTYVSLPDDLDLHTLTDTLTNGASVSLQAPRWQHIQIGDYLLRVND